MMRIPFSTRAEHIPAPVPQAGLVMLGLLSALNIVVLITCLGRRLLLLRRVPWSSLPLVRWLIFAIYIDSLLFIITTAILVWAYGLNKTHAICSTAIYLCLAFYMSTKILIYYFLVEKVFIIRAVSIPRLKSKLYCFNCFGLLLPFIVIVGFNFAYRIAYMDKSGTCIIGLQLKVLMPLIIFDAIINLYLTIIFVIPLRALYSYQNNPDSKVRTIALRSFIGSCGTLTSSIVNLTVLMVLRGEAAWICLMCCNADVLFSILMLHWVTSKDSAGTRATTDPSSRNTPGGTQPQSWSLKNKLSMFSPNSKADTLPKGWEWTPGRITTEIHACEDDHELDRIPQDKGGINVKIGHTVVVETRGGENASSGSVLSENIDTGGGKSECDVVVDPIVPGRSNRRREGSMEDLVKKSEK
ncbi:hypothetical protein BGZ60DRAFT_398913 [Tricladium varicosporioides]|nr:hypothetical protein BGZ60DRAFT_398913 [Hymenoscyphus varicosporioides]